MRVFLRRKRIGLYYRGSGEVDGGLGQALEFASVPAAARRALTEKLADVEIVLRCDYLDREIPLPVTPLWGEVGDPHGRFLQGPASSASNPGRMAPTPP